MPIWAVSLITTVAQQLISLVIKHYERREDELDAEAKEKLARHRAALNVLKPNLTKEVKK